MMKTLVFLLLVLTHWTGAAPVQEYGDSSLMYRCSCGGGGGYDDGFPDDTDYPGGAGGGYPEDDDYSGGYGDYYPDDSTGNEGGSMGGGKFPGGSKHGCIRGIVVIPIPGNAPGRPGPRLPRPRPPGKRPPGPRPPGKRPPGPRPPGPKPPAPGPPAPRPPNFKCPPGWHPPHLPNMIVNPPNMIINPPNMIVHPPNMIVHPPQVHPVDYWPPHPHPDFGPPKRRRCVCTYS